MTDYYYSQNGQPEAAFEEDDYCWSDWYGEDGIIEAMLSAEQRDCLVASR